MSQIINWCEEHQESGGEACWYWEANKTWERPCHMVERIVVNPSDALIIRRDDIDYEAAAKEIAWSLSLGLGSRVEPSEVLTSARTIVDAALASSQGVEP